MDYFNDAEQTFFKPVNLTCIIAGALPQRAYSVVLALSIPEELEGLTFLNSSLIHTPSSKPVETTPYTVTFEEDDDITTPEFDLGSDTGLGSGGLGRPGGGLFPLPFFNLQNVAVNPEETAVNNITLPTVVADEELSLGGDSLSSEYPSMPANRRKRYLSLHCTF